MSRGFVKEEDQEEAPFIPPRASLPEGLINYVTQHGYDLLQSEREKLEYDFAHVAVEDEKEKRHERAVINGKLQLLQDRISSARIIYYEDQPQDEVRFGALVKFKYMEGDQKNDFQEFQIVGVDEADIKLKKIAFVAPLSKALLGKKVGEETRVFMAGTSKNAEILEIKYP